MDYVWYLLGRPCSIGKQGTGDIIFEPLLPDLIVRPRLDNHWLNCTATWSVDMLVLSQKVMFCGGQRKRWVCYVRRHSSSKQRKAGKKEAWRPKCAVSRLGYEQNQKVTYYFSYLGHQNEVTFVGRSLNVQKVSLLFSLGSFEFVGLITTREVGREGGGGVLNEDARVAANCQKKIK